MGEGDGKGVTGGLLSPQWFFLVSLLLDFSELSLDGGLEGQDSQGV